MAFSLIVATVDRNTTIYKLLETLCSQTYKNFEVIIVDQNDDNRLSHVISIYSKKILIKHIRSSRGLSKARNAGLQHAENEWICFPDDDCWYPDDMLLQLAKVMKGSCDSFVTFKAEDDDGVPIARFSRAPGQLSTYNIWTRCSSISLCMQRDAVLAVKGFDEELGLGAGTKWEAGEDYELPIRMLRKGYTGSYHPEIVVHHDVPAFRGWDALARRARTHSPAIGRIWKVHKFPVWFCLYHLGRPLGGAFLALLSLQPAKSFYRWEVFCGRLKGWLL